MSSSTVLPLPPELFVGPDDPLPQHSCPTALQARFADSFAQNQTLSRKHERQLRESNIKQNPQAFDPLGLFREDEEKRKDALQLRKKALALVAQQAEKEEGKIRNDIFWTFREDQKRGEFTGGMARNTFVLDREIKKGKFESKQLLLDRVGGDSSTGKASLRASSCCWTAG